MRSFTEKMVFELLNDLGANLVATHLQWGEPQKAVSGDANQSGYPPEKLSRCLHIRILLLAQLDLWQQVDILVKVSVHFQAKWLRFGKKGTDCRLRQVNTAKNINSLESFVCRIIKRMTLELVISDLDGTILETEDYHRLAYNHLFKELSLEVS